MNARQIRTATRLAEMASSARGISYTVRAGAPVEKMGRKTYYPVSATSPEGCWDYYLAAEDGSYAGLPATVFK